MDESQAKQRLTEIMSRFTPGSVLHLLAEVLKEAATGELDEAARESLRDASGALFVVGIGIDAVWSGRPR